jgi:hypothetical protein
MSKMNWINKNASEHQKWLEEKEMIEKKMRS